MDKISTRIEFRRRRRDALHKSSQEKRVRQLALRIIRPSHKKIAIYKSVHSEFPTDKLIHEIISKGKSVYLPVVKRYNKILTFKLGRQVLSINRMDIVFTPLVAFDQDAFRLGQGGGYYDRAFARYIKSNRKVGLAFREQFCNFSLKFDDFDQKLDTVLTADQRLLAR